MRLHDVLAGARTLGDDRCATPSEITAAFDGAEIVGDLGVEITSVVCDSREATPGALFCCVPGLTTDGHDFAAQAVSNGARALVVERLLDGIDAAVVQLVVPSTMHAVGPIAAVVAGRPSHDLVVLGVTGTNGKTTTTYLLEAIAKHAMIDIGVIGTTGTRFAGTLEASSFTTPDACALQALLARMRDRDVRAVAMEISSHALAQRRVLGTEVAIAAFTNLSHDHLDYHDSFADYAAAKALLFTRTYTNSAAINVDDPFGRELVGGAARDLRDVWTYSLAGSADVTGRDVCQVAGGSRFTFGGARVAGTHDVTLPLLGTFNVSNALAAATIALAAGWPLDALLAGLAAAPVVPGRFESIANEAGIAVVVDYAHTPEALSRVLDALRPIAAESAGRILCVFGCGGDRDRAKRPRMGAAVEVGADVVILTSDNPRSEEPAAIAADVIAGIADPEAVVVELDRRAAIALALGDARRGDVVLIAGKGHEAGQTVGSVTTPFDDRSVARELLGARR